MLHQSTRKKGCLIGVSLFLGVSLLPLRVGSTASATPKPRTISIHSPAGNQWLFIIGIDKYRYDSGWGRLTTAVNDAKTLRDVLLDRYQFKKEHLVELYDRRATRKNIIAKLGDLARKVRGNDSLVIYFAGHGAKNTITKTGSWVPMGSTRNDPSGWISSDSVVDYLKVDAIRARHILLISDSCFAGKFFSRRRGKPLAPTGKALLKAYRLTSRWAITSGGDEPYVRSTS